MGELNLKFSRANLVCMEDSCANAVPQRRPKVLKGYELLSQQEEFKLDNVMDEATVLSGPWIISTLNIVALTGSLLDFEAPSNSPYYPQTLRLQLTFHSRYLLVYPTPLIDFIRYPFEPPSAKFLDAVYHPNIDTNGNICLDLLKPIPTGSWRPSIDVITLLTAIKLLLAEPNPDDPLMPDIAAEYRDDLETYLENAKAVSLGKPVSTKRVEEGPSPIEAKPEKRGLLKLRGTVEKRAEDENQVVIINTVKPEAVEAKEPVVVVNMISEDEEFETLPKVRKTLLSSRRA